MSFCADYYSGYVASGLLGFPTKSYGATCDDTSFALRAMTVRLLRFGPPSPSLSHFVTSLALILPSYTCYSSNCSWFSLLGASAFLLLVLPSLHCAHRFAHYLHVRNSVYLGTYFADYFPARIIPHLLYNIGADFFLFSAADMSLSPFSLIALIPVQSPFFRLWSNCLGFVLFYTPELAVQMPTSSPLCFTSWPGPPAFSVSLSATRSIACSRPVALVLIYLLCFSSFS